MKRPMIWVGLFCCFDLWGSASSSSASPTMSRPQYRRITPSLLQLPPGQNTPENKELWNKDIFDAAVREENKKSAWSCLKKLYKDKGEEDAFRFALNHDGFMKLIDDDLQMQLLKSYGTDNPVARRILSEKQYKVPFWKWVRKRRLKYAHDNARGVSSKKQRTALRSRCAAASSSGVSSHFDVHKHPSGKGKVLHTKKSDAIAGVVRKFYDEIKKINGREFDCMIELSCIIKKLKKLDEGRADSVLKSDAFCTMVDRIVKNERSFEEQVFLYCLRTIAVMIDKTHPKYKAVQLAMNSKGAAREKPTTKSTIVRCPSTWNLSEFF